jgi:hypothetical protein
MSGGPDEADAPDGRSATAKAAEWASRIMTISLGMVLPGLAGYWLDTKLKTRVVFLFVGFGLGGYLAFLQLRTIARSTTNQSGKKSTNSH